MLMAKATNRDCSWSQMLEGVLDSLANLARELAISLGGSPMI